MKKKTHIIDILSIVVISTLFLLIFSDSTSPLTRTYYGSDSAFYLLAGKCIKNGYIVYKDIFDQKGPYFFFLEALSQFICEGKIGIFVVQIINLTVSLLLVSKIYNLVEKKISFIERFILIIPFLWHLAGTFQAGNLTEEFALPFAIYAIYGFAYYIKNRKDYTHSPKQALIYGLMFGVLSLSRISNSAILCSVVFTIAILLIINKQYINLFKNAVAFICGVFLAFLPMIIYFNYYGELNEMLYSVFLFGFDYAMEYGLYQRMEEYFTFQNISFLIAALIPILLASKSKTHKKEYLMLTITCAITSIICTMIGYCLLHYFILLAPFVILSEFIVLDDHYFWKYKKTLTTCLICILLLQAYSVAIHFGNSLVHTVDYNLTYNERGYYSRLNNETNEIVEQIPANERDAIWGYNIGSRFYLRANILPCIKYYDFIDFSYNVIKEGVFESLNNNRIKWFVLAKNEFDIPNILLDTIENDFVLYYENSFFELYQLKR